MPARALRMIRKRMPATSDEPIPMRIVSPIVIGSGPGRASRPSPPTIAPQTSRNRMKAIKPMGGLLGHEDLVSSPAGTASSPTDEERVGAAEHQERDDEPDHRAEHRPEDEAEHEPADNTDTDRLADGPLLLAGQDRPQRHTENRALDQQAEDEAD